MRFAPRCLFRALVLSVYLVAGAVIVGAVAVPRLTGATPYTITTGSMTPAYRPGTVIVVRPVDAGDIAVGDVITVQLESGRDTMVTHRVTGLRTGTDGGLAFATKGDANAAPDPDLRRPVQVRGEVWYSIPVIGHLSTALTPGQRSRAVTGIGLGSLAYATWMFVGSWLDHRRGRREHRPAGPRTASPG
ncbi:MAG: signal peptidase I [Acidimicrobiales bacterium]